MSHANLGLTPRDASPGVKGERLAPSLYGKVFCDLTPPLSPTEAVIESARCFYCYDAPCIRSCPSEIDIPSFIRKIGNGNVRGAASDILEANILGGSCARVCPVETLCQEACVREKSDAKPVEIAKLQRHATDFAMAAFEKTGKTEFTREKPNGKKVAVVGAGPAGLSAAHHLARMGFGVTIFEAKAKAGGLNEYGIAPYKMVNRFAEREAAFILSLGGIEVRYEKSLGKDFTLETLRKDFDAVFLGIGLGTNNALEVPGEELAGVQDATKKIEEIRQAKDLSQVKVGRDVIVVGGGNTAVDIAVQMKRLGAETVTLVYRRGTEQMGATDHEQEIAANNGVSIRTWAMPKEIRGSHHGVTEMEFEYAELNAAGKLVGTSKTFTLKADQVFKAIGQKLVAPAGLEVARGKITVNGNFETTVAGVYAGGDCVAEGEDLTVTSAQHGKLAARAIFAKLFPGKPIPYVQASSAPQDTGGGSPVGATHVKHVVLSGTSVGGKV